MAAGVDQGDGRAQGDAGLVRVGLGNPLGQLSPRGRCRWVTRDELVLDQPRLFVLAPPPHRGLEPIALHVHRAREHGHARGHERRIFRVAAAEALFEYPLFDRGPVVFPGLAPHGIHELAEADWVGFDDEKLAHEVRPRGPR